MTNLFRIISQIEGCSFLLLLFIAMPLKYYFGMPEAVSLVGMGHGILFILYTFMSLSVAQRHEWSMGYWVMILLAGMVPFGFLMIDSRLRRDVKRELANEVA